METREQIQERVQQPEDEIEANEQENRFTQEEINRLSNPLAKGCSYEEHLRSCEKFDPFGTWDELNSYESE